MPDRNRGIYYLLEYALTFHVPVGQLPRPDFDEYLNKPHHHLDRGVLIDVLLDLAQTGDIFFELGEERIASPSRALVEEGLIPRDFPNGLYYGLTAQGGGRWTKWAHPDWSAYVSREFELLEESAELHGTSGSLWEATLVSQSRDRAQQYLDSMPYFRELVEDGTVQWEPLSPCPLVYWKTVPSGHKATCRYLEVDGIPPVALPTDRSEREDLMDIFSSCGWFTRPGFEG